MTERRAVVDVSLFSDNLTPGLQLGGEVVRLEPLSTDHIEPLIFAASSGQLWTLPYTGVPSPDSMPEVVKDALKQRDLGTQLPFAVILKSTAEVVGTTRYYYIQPESRNLSIGYTWYAQHVQRTGVNTECKYLLLRHAFEVMKCISVQWHTDHRNKRSQAAIKRIGAKFEGVLRNHKIMPDGVIRHTHCFSMLDIEWPASKAYLQSRLAYFSQGQHS